MKFRRPFWVLFFCFLSASMPLLADEVQGFVIPYKAVTISSPLQDIIKKIWVEEGDEVKEGQPLVGFDSAKEELDVAQNQMAVQRNQFAADGTQELYKEHMASHDVALEKKTELDVAKIGLKAAQNRLDQKTVRSPLSGIVVKKYKEAGEGVEPVEKLLDIVDISKVYIQFYIDPKFIGKLWLSEKVPVRFPNLENNRTYNGSITFMDPRIDAASGLFRVKLLLDNPTHEIKAGMRGEADFSKAAP